MYIYLLKSFFFTKLNIIVKVNVTIPMIISYNLPFNVGLKGLIKRYSLNFLHIKSLS